MVSALYYFIKENVEPLLMLFLFLFMKIFQDFEIVFVFSLCDSLCHR